MRRIGGQELSYCRDVARLLGQFILRPSRKLHPRCKYCEFYGTTTLWCLSLNLVVGRYGTQP